MKCVVRTFVNFHCYFYMMNKNTPTLTFCPKIKFIFMIDFIKQQILFWFVALEEEEDVN